MTKPFMNLQQKELPVQDLVLCDNPRERTDTMSCAHLQRISQLSLLIVEELGVFPYHFLHVILAKLPLVLGKRQSSQVTTTGQGLGFTYEGIRKLVMVKTFWSRARGYSQYCRYCAVSVKLIDSLVPPMNFDGIMPQFVLRILEGGGMHSLCLPGIWIFCNNSTHY